MRKTLAVLGMGTVCLSTYAQQVESAGVIRGIVTDSGGGVIAGASIVARNQATGVSNPTLTNDAGAYRIANLAIGSYDLEIGFKGFQTIRRTGLRLVAGATLTEDVTLPIGEATQVVTVTAQAALVDSGSTTTGNTRVVEELKDLPMQIPSSWRSSASYLFTLPGFNADVRVGDVEQKVGRGSHMGIGGSNGFASSFAGYTIDGLTAATNMSPSLEDNGPLPPELVSEIRYATNLNAESGNHLGSAMILVTKSGTNQIHGTAFEYWRNNVLDARNFQVATVRKAKQNEYGLVLGGPIVKNKLFAFGSWSSYKMRADGAPSQWSVPTGRMRTGNFSEWLGPQIGTDSMGRSVLRGQIFDPLSNQPDGRGGVVRDPFPNNVIPASRMSPISLFFQKRYELPNLPGTQLNWFGPSLPETRDYDRWAIKVDNNFWQSHRLTVGFDIMPKRLIGPGTFSPPTALISAGGRDDRQYRMRIVENWIPRPDILVSFRTGINRYKFFSDIPPETLTLGCESGLKGVLACNAPYTFIELESGFGFLWARYYRFWTEVPADLDVSLHKGKHDFKFGAQFQQQVATIISYNNSQGQFNFSARETGVPGLPQSGVGYASYLLGVVDSATVNAPKPNKYAARYIGFFAQDQWRVTPKLTLTYGLRWDITRPISEKWDRIGSFDPSIPNAAAGGRPGALTFWGQGPGRNGRDTLYDTYWKAFGPRVGVAYSLNSKTVLRAYYGLLYAPIIGDFIGGDDNIANYGWGFSVSRTSLDAGITPAFNWNDGFPPILPTIPNLDPTQLNGSGLTRYVPTDSRPARAQNLGFSIERELPGDLLLKGEYVGKLIHGLLSFGYYSPPVNEPDIKYLSLGSLLSANINSPEARAAGIPIPYPGFTGTVVQALRPYPQYLGISMPGSRSHFSLYNALLITAQKRFRHGLSFLLGYTVSKHFERGPVQHLSLLDTGKTLMAYDRPQVVTLSYSYDLPFGPGKRFLQTSKPVVKHIVSGWQITGVHNYGSGIPVSVTTRGTIPGFGGQWAKVNPNVLIPTGSGCAEFDNAYPSGQYSYLNRAAFYSPSPFTYGDTRVLPNVRQCGSAEENLTLIKSFPVKENIQIRFGAAFFNILNRHWWGGLQTDIDNPGVFGRFTSASAPRTGQLWLRLEF